MSEIDYEILGWILEGSRHYSSPEEMKAPITRENLTLWAIAGLEDELATADADRAAYLEKKKALLQAQLNE